jgi:hypothetical protein
LHSGIALSCMHAVMLGYGMPWVHNFFICLPNLRNLGFNSLNNRSVTQRIRLHLAFAAQRMRINHVWVQCGGEITRLPPTAVRMNHGGHYRDLTGPASWSWSRNNKLLPCVWCVVCGVCAFVLRNRIRCNRSRHVTPNMVLAQNSDHAHWMRTGLSPIG